MSTAARDRRASRREKFAQSVEARQEEKAQEESNQQYEDIQYLPLKRKRQAVMRFLGLPEHVREEGSDVRLLEYALIKDDNGKWFRCIFPKDQDFILREIYRKVCSYDWDNKRNIPVYHHADLEIFTKVRYCDAPPSRRQMASGWRPQQSMLINVIDRSDPEWHAENSHAKVIAKKMTVKDENTYFNPGLPISAYKSIQDDIQALKGNMDWEMYDIVIEKLDDQPWYKVMHGEQDAHRLKDYAEELVVVGDLTDEELEYELYDFDKLFPFTTYRKILNRLRLQIKEVDETFETRFLEKLEDLAASEKKEQDKTRKASSAASRDEDDDDEDEDEASPRSRRRSEPEEDEEPEIEDSDDDEDEDDPEDVEEDDEEPPKAKKSSRRSRRSAKTEEPEEEEESVGLDFGKLAKKFKGIKHLGDEGRALIIDVDEDGNLVYDAPQEDLVPCIECGHEAPEYAAITHCPNCGVEFEDE